MNLPDWLTLFMQQVQATHFLEWAGVAFGVTEVLLARLNHIALYPAGIISVVISMYIFFNAGLYAESLLNMYYLVMSIYGWWAWTHNNTGTTLSITKANAKDWKITAVIVVGGFLVLFYCLSRFTDSTVPAWDAWVSATAWAGMWLLARRKIENWILLNISNAFAIPLLFHKQLPLYMLLTVFLFLVAIQSYFRWKKLMTHQTPASNTSPHEHPL